MLHRFCCHENNNIYFYDTVESEKQNKWMTSDDVSDTHTHMLSICEEARKNKGWFTAYGYRRATGRAWQVTGLSRKSLTYLGRFEKDENEQKYGGPAEFHLVSTQPKTRKKAVVSLRRGLAERKSRHPTMLVVYDDRRPVRVPVLPGGSQRRRATLSAAVGRQRVMVGRPATFRGSYSYFSSPSMRSGGEPTLVRAGGEVAAEGSDHDSSLHEA